MIDKAEWWSIVSSYLQTISPTQYFVFTIFLILVCMLFGKYRQLSSRLINLMLALSFLWQSIGFFLVFGRQITGETYGNYFFSVIFLTLAVFYFSNFFKHKTVYLLDSPLAKICAIGILILYPIIGAITHQNFLYCSFAGTMPCPTVAAALILLIFTNNKLHPIALVLLLMWAIPTTPFLQIGRYGVYEDTLLVLAGVGFLIHWIFTGKKNKFLAI